MTDHDPRIAAPIDWIAEAKTKAPRRKRMATAPKWLAEGQPRNWNHLSC